MVARTSFFAASLWAPLPLVGILVIGCIWILFFPGTLGLGEGGRHAAGVALFAVPMAYTALFGATYFIARALYAVNLLSFWSLLAVCALVAFSSGGLVAAFGYDERRMLILAAAVCVGGFLGLASVALLWWRVASRTPPLVPVYEKPRSSRSRPQRAPEETVAPTAVETASPREREVLSDELIVRWDAGARRLQIVHPDRSRYPAPLAEVRESALAGGSVEDTARLVGEALTRLMPALRAHCAAAAPANDTQHE